jgi:hypothetical protein
MDRRSFLAGAGASVAALALPPVAAAAESVGEIARNTRGDYFIIIGPGPRVIRWSVEGDYETWSPSAT